MLGLHFPQVQPSASQLPFVQIRRGDELVGKRAAPEFAPQRVHVVYHDSIRADPFLNRSFSDQDGPFQRAVRVLSNALMVRPLQGRVTIAPNCTNITSGPNAGKCQRNTLQNTCGVFTVPDELAGVRETCDGETGSCSEQGQAGNGVEADYILFAGAQNCEERDANS